MSTFRVVRSPRRLHGTCAVHHVSLTRQPTICAFFIGWATLCGNSREEHLACCRDIQGLIETLDLDEASMALDLAFLAEIVAAKASFHNPELLICARRRYVVIGTRRSLVLSNPELIVMTHILQYTLSSKRFIKSAL